MSTSGASATSIDPTGLHATGLDPIRLDQARMAATTAALGARVGEMAARRDEVGATVDRLLVVWRGPAADRFRAHWETWRDGADAVIDQLAGIVGGIERAHGDLTAADTGSEVASERLAGRLLGRLG